MTMVHRNGEPLTLEALYNAIASITIIKHAPEDIQNKFNTLKNLTAYTWLDYGLHPIAQLQSYILIEYALSKKTGKDKWGLHKLLNKAVTEGLINDTGFNHINPEVSTNNIYSKELIGILPKLRNDSAHGNNPLYPGSVFHLQICADFINQLFGE
jgi:hypothetical protein